MNTATIKKSKGPVHKTKYPWTEWLKGTFEKPTVLVFGVDIPAKKSVPVFITQLHQWAARCDKWAYTSKSIVTTKIEGKQKEAVQIQIYAVPRKKGKKRPDSLFPYPDQSKRVADRKATKTK